MSEEIAAYVPLPQLANRSETAGLDWQLPLPLHIQEEQVGVHAEGYRQLARIGFLKTVTVEAAPPRLCEEPAVSVVGSGIATAVMGRHRNAPRPGRLELMPHDDSTTHYDALIRVDMQGIQRIVERERKVGSPDAWAVQIGHQVLGGMYLASRTAIFKNNAAEGAGFLATLGICDIVHHIHQAVPEFPDMHLNRTTFALLVGLYCGLKTLNDVRNAFVEGGPIEWGVLPFGSDRRMRMALNALRYRNLMRGLPAAA